MNHGINNHLILKEVKEIWHLQKWFASEKIEVALYNFH